MVGNAERSIPMMASNSGSQSWVRMFIIMVRLAFVTSVVWMPPFTPPVRFQISHESIVPTSILPSAIASFTPGKYVRAQYSFGPVK